MSNVPNAVHMVALEIPIPLIVAQQLAKMVRVL